MKKTILIIIGVLCTSFAFSQSEPKENETDSLLTDIYCELMEINMKLQHSEFVERYKLYKTENMYTFLKLNTATGEIDQIQWSLDSNNEGSVPINTEDLSFILKINGNFELFPTNNMYQFLLLDKSLGKVWHVQWGMKSTERWIRRIN